MSSSDHVVPDVVEREGTDDNLTKFLDSLAVPAAEDRSETESTVPLVDLSINDATLNGRKYSRPSSPQRSRTMEQVVPTSSWESLTVMDDDDRAPVDWILSRRLPLNSRRFYRKAIAEGRVKIDGRTVKSLVRAKSGSTLSVEAPVQNGDRAVLGGFSPAALFPQHLPDMAIVYEDDYLFAVWKPAGMVCQPCEGAKSGTVLHGLFHHMVRSKQTKGGDMVAAKTLSQGIVHRLDKHTSGVMIVAKVR